MNEQVHTNEFLTGDQLVALMTAPPTPSEAVDALEQAMMQHPAQECPLEHRFTPGLYIRTIFMPAGSLVTSKIHKTEHPFVVLKGRVSVWMVETQTWELLEAPHTGITKPGTRRVLVVHEDTIWTTFHPTTLTDLAEIEAAIIEPHREHLAGLVQPAHQEIAL